MALLPGAALKELFRLTPTLHLRCLKQVQVKFDPFHDNALHIRDFVFYLSVPYVRSTNPKCSVKTDVVCDNSEPEVKVITDTGHKILFRAGNLNILELIQEYIKAVNKFDVSEPVSEPIKIATGKKAKKK